MTRLAVSVVFATHGFLSSATVLSHAA